MPFWFNLVMSLLAKNRTVESVIFKTNSLQNKLQLIVFHIFIFSNPAYQNFNNFKNLIRKQIVWQSDEMCWNKLWTNILEHHFAICSFELVPELGFDVLHLKVFKYLSGKIICCNDRSTITSRLYCNL